MALQYGFVCGEHVLSKADFDERVMRAAQGLKALGVAPGDAVALLLRNDIAFLEATLAATAAGAYAVPVNWRFAKPEVEYVLADCAAKVLIAHANVLAADRLELKPATTVLTVPTPPAVRAAFALDPAACTPDDDAVLWDSWLQAHEPLAEAEKSVPMTMIYTSGTTGLPKGVRRQPQSTEDAGRLGARRARLYGIRPDSRVLLPGPLYHSAPNSCGVTAAKVAELTVLMPRFDAEDLLALIERHRVTTIFMVPTMFVRLLQLPQELRARYDLSSLRYVLHAAAPCPTEIKERMIDWWGPVIHEFYGSTEAGYVTYCTAAEALAKPGTAGRAVDGTVLQILDHEGNALPPGAPGVVYSHMPAMPDFTYHNRPEERAAIERRGMVTSGDVGYLDADGYLFLCDREKDMVISGGVNIYPAEIEGALATMPGVADCAVIGVPDAEFGETLLALVQPPDRVTLETEDVTGYLRGRIADYKVPRRLEFRAELPREDSGKIFKRRLREPYWAAAGRRI